MASETPQAEQARLTHPDRVYWPEDGVTKRDLADYYAEVWSRMAPHVVGRPLALVRCPEGIGAGCFFAKHAWKGMSPEIAAFRDPLAAADAGLLIGVDGLAGLLGLVQGAALEVHGWQSTRADLERPDQAVFDLDPGEGVPWEATVGAAWEVRRRLEAQGLAAFVKTSGGKGLHVVTPLVPDAGWEAVKDFAAGLARAMAEAAPDRYVATIAKAKRTGRILIDYLRNGRNETAIVPYATRARPGAAVSMPLGWEELEPGAASMIGPAAFTVRNTPARLYERPDPWADFRAAARPLAKR